MAFEVSVDDQEGATGFRLLDYLSQRDGIELPRIAEDKRKDSAERTKFLNAANAAFLCLPDAAPHRAVSLVNNPNICIINASIVLRTSDDRVYGLPEPAQGQRERLHNTRRIAVPDYHASTFVLLMRPLVDVGIILADYPVTASLLTGYSDGGKQMTADYLAASNLRLDNSYPYALALAHRHPSEMCVQGKLSFIPIFTPVVGNFLRGLVVMIGPHPQHLTHKTSPADIARVLAGCYQDGQFIRVAPADNVVTLDNGFLDVQGANDTSRADLSVFSSDERMVVTACLDNLGKDATGAAVQYMNVYLDVGEATSLYVGAPVPAVGIEYTVREVTLGLAS